MQKRSKAYHREALNQLINLFWTVLCFAPVLVYWVKKGIDPYFYFFLAPSFIIGLLPAAIIDQFTISSNRKVYEKMGVKQIRKFVQNGDAVRAITSSEKQLLINAAGKAQRYLKTIAMYERYHWICFSFFQLTTIRCFYDGQYGLGLMITIANIVYNLSSILLQQYNRVRINKITA